MPKLTSTAYCSSVKSTLQKSIRQKLINYTYLDPSFWCRPKLVQYAMALGITLILSCTLNAQDIEKKDSKQQTNQTDLKNANSNTIKLSDIIDARAEPIGGYQQFYKALADSMQYPKSLKEKGKVYVQFTVDTLGIMSNFKVLKGYNAVAEKTAIETLSRLHYPFRAAEKNGKKVKMRLVVPIVFDPEVN